MNAAAKILMIIVAVSVGVISVVFYRWDVISGVKRAMHAASQEDTAIALTTANTPPPEEMQQKGVLVAANDKPSLSNGKKLYEANCVLCHGADGKADSATGKALKATNLAAEAFQHNDKKMEPTKYIMHVIENGVPGTGMASFKAQIPNEKDRKEVSEYVRSLHK